MRITTDTIEAPADLKPFIKGFWHIAAIGTEGEISPMQCCLPDGLTELIIHLNPKRHSGRLGGEWMTFPEAYLVGLMSEPVYWNMEAGGELFGISIKPETFVTLFDLPINEIADRFAKVEDFFGNLLGDLVSQIQQAPDNAARAGLAAQYFRNRRAAHEDRQPYFFRALEYIRKSTVLEPMEDICEQVFVGKRQLQRAFQDNLGLSAKTYGRIIRFSKAYEFSFENPQVKLTEIAHEFGYADQSHFIRDFKAFTGGNPKAFMAKYEFRARMRMALSN